MPEQHLDDASIDVVLEQMRDTRLCAALRKVNLKGAQISAVAVSGALQEGGDLLAAGMYPRGDRKRCRRSLSHCKEWWVVKVSNLRPLIKARERLGFSS
jgi:hypothetical protein